MFSVILNKLWQLALVVFATGFISFALFSWTNDPVDALLGENATVEDRANLRAELGYDQPFYVQYARFMTRAAQGNFGKSLRSNEPVSDLLKQRFPATFELVLLGAGFTLALGISLGLYTGTHRHRKSSQFILSVSLLGVSLPTFLLGLLAIYLFSVHLGWFPAAGRGGTTELGWWQTSFLTFEGWKGIFMPALTLAIFNVGLFIRLVRSEVLEIRTMDYIKFARARGIDERTINRTHVLPNAMKPVINVAALIIGTMIAFSLITETVFQWPGLGLMFVQAIGFSDFPVMAAYFMLVAVMFVTLNLIADILLNIVDPRLRRA